METINHRTLIKMLARKYFKIPKGVYINLRQQEDECKVWYTSDRTGDVVVYFNTADLL